MYLQKPIIEKTIEHIPHSLLSTSVAHSRIKNANVSTLYLAFIGLLTVVNVTSITAGIANIIIIILTAYYDLKQKPKF